MASEIDWRTGIVGDWFVAGNWVQSTIPTTGDIATIADGTATIASPSIRWLASRLCFRRTIRS